MKPFEKAPAYERGSKNTEHKISDFTEKKWTCQLRMYRPKGDIDSSQLILSIGEKDFVIHTHFFGTFLPENPAIYAPLSDAF